MQNQGNSNIFNTYIFKCLPGSRFHLGLDALDNKSGLNNTSEIIHSDTLTGAIISIASKFLPEDDFNSFLNLLKSADIMLSSGFFCVEKADGAIVYFLPVPVITSLAPEVDLKKLKKVKFLSLKVWNEGLDNIGHWLDKNKYTLLENGFLCFKNELPENTLIYSRVLTPGVKVRSVDGKDSLFHVASIQLSHNTERAQPHFYTIYKVSEKVGDKEKQILRTCLEILKDEGVGGERSSGFGRFKEVVEGNLKIEVNNKKPISYVGTSLLLPDRVKTDALQYYKLITRGGRRIGSRGESLKKVKVVLEGSWQSESLPGTFVNLHLMPLS